MAGRQEARLRISCFFVDFRFRHSSLDPFHDHFHDALSGRRVSKDTQSYIVILPFEFEAKLKGFDIVHNRSSIATIRRISDAALHHFLFSRRGRCPTSMQTLKTFLPLTASYSIALSQRSSNPNELTEPNLFAAYAAPIVAFLQSASIGSILYAISSTHQFPLLHSLILTFVFHKLYS